MARSVENVYADALLAVAKETGKEERLLQDAEALLQAFRENPGIQERIFRPGLGKSAREEIVRELFAEAVEPETLNFLFVVSEKNRGEALTGILERFVRIAEEALGIGRVSVRSAFPVSEAEKAAIEKRIRETTSFMTLRFAYETDESLVGGIVIRIGDRVVDGSVKNRLEKLTGELLKTRVD